MSTVQTITANQAAQNKGTAFLLDVRTPAEFQDIHIEGSMLHPLGDLNPRVVEQLAAGKSHCILICGSGNRARQAFEKLSGSTIPNLTVLEGGVTAWEGAGLPVVRGKKTISLERQVRIAAGALVVIGSALGYLFNPVFIGLAAFVGAGLIFAGVTDTCGLAMVLANMPWNTRVKSCGSCCSMDSDK